MSVEIPMLRTSERRTAKNCQQQWDWAWNEGLEKKGLPDTPLWFGTGIHLAMANWYSGPGVKRGPHPAETWKSYSDQILDTVRIPGLTDEDEAVHVDAGELGISMMENYVKTYGKDEHMHIIQPEQSFNLDVPWPKLADGHILKGLTESRALLTNYVGTYDLVWRDLATDQIWLEEHKTAAIIRVEHLRMDDQGGSYWATASRGLQKRGLIKPNEHLRGIEYNFMRKALPDARPKNADGAYTNKPIKKHYTEALANIPLGEWNPKMKLEDLQAVAQKYGITVLGDPSKQQGTPLFLRERIHRTSKERNAQLRRIQNEALQIELVRSRVVEPSKNPTINCARFCQFFDLCELHERGGDVKEFKKMWFKKRDVYADHRKSTDE